LIARSILILQNAEAKARNLKARAHALAPWLVGEPVAKRRLAEDGPQDGGRT